MVKKIIFDMDGVIIDSFKFNVMFYRDLMRLGGFPIPSREMLIEVHKLTFRESVEKLTSREDKKTLEKMLKLSEKIYPKYEKYIKLVKNCKETLNELSKKYKLAIATGRRDTAIPLLEKFDIKKFFDVVVTYEDYKKPKPDPEPILVALKRLDSKPEEAVYVGDNELDMEAAKAAGVKVIIYSNKEVPDADFYIDSFDEIKSIASNS